MGACELESGDVALAAIPVRKMTIGIAQTLLLIIDWRILLCPRRRPVADRNPDVLATYRDVRCHSSIETIRAALVGNDRHEHVFALTQSLELYDVYQAKMLD